jgi:tRNA-dihydrouridine synthase 1
MFHSRLFATSPVYRQQSFQPPHLDGAAGDRPVFVQFCSNEPADLLAAAKEVQAHCDAVDLNLGCPQGIARKGHYGAFLQEDWGLIHSLVRTLHEGLEVPVTAKIRILETKERSLEYAKMVVEAGAQVLTVHGRTREQKGHNTGLADWSYIKYLRDHLPKEVVMFANGNVLWHEDVERCITATGVDGVMSAEGNLYNPAIFSVSADWDERFPRMDKIGREYLDIIRHQILPHLPLAELLAQEPSKRSRKKLNEVFKDANLTPIKSHLFKLWHALLPRHIEVRNMVGRASTRHMGPGSDPLSEYEECLHRVEGIIKEELEHNPEEVDSEGRWAGPDREITDGDDAGEEEEGIVVEIGEKRYRRHVPWYRCQPYYRPLPEKAMENGALKTKAEKGTTRKAEDPCGDGPEPKKTKRSGTDMDEWENGPGKDQKVAG